MQPSFIHTTCPLSSVPIFQSYYLSIVKRNYLSNKLLVHCQVQLSLSTIKCNYLSIILLVHYLSIILLVYYPMYLSFNQTTCPLSNVTIFQSNYLSTIQCNYLSIKLLVHYQVQLSFSQTPCHCQVQLSFSQTTCPLSFNQISCSLSNVTIYIYIFHSYDLSTIKCNYLSAILLVHCQVQLSFNQTPCHCQVQLSFSQTTCPLSFNQTSCSLSNVTIYIYIFHSYDLSTIKCNYLSAILLVHYQVQLSFNQTPCHCQVQLSFSQTTCPLSFNHTSCPLSNVTIYIYIFHSYYLSTVKCNYLSIKLLVHCQVQLSFSQTTCPLSFNHTSCPLSNVPIFHSYYVLVRYQVQLSFSHTTCPLSSATIFQSYYLSTVK